MQPSKGYFKQPPFSQRDSSSSSVVHATEPLDPDILAYVESSEPLETIDESIIKKMVIKFEKAITKNHEMRMKFSNQPEKFLASESELDAAIKNFMVLSTSSDLYPLLLQYNVVDSLLNLLGHENGDIANAVIELLKELLDEDVQGESDDRAIFDFSEYLIKNNLLELMMSNLERLDESIEGDKQGVFSTLGLLENLISLEPNKLEPIIIEKTKLIHWLIKRIQKNPMDLNKLYSSEILAILLQNRSDCSKSFLAQEGIDIILKALSFYRKQNVTDLEETEFMENLFDCLCSCLLDPFSKDIFVKAQGIELMILMLRENKQHRLRTLKTLNYALATIHGANACEHFVNVFGLKTIFPIFMSENLNLSNSSSSKNLKKSMQDHEHLMSILSSLCMNLRITERELPYQRWRFKFQENNFEKLVKLLQYRQYYTECLDSFEKVHDLERLDEEETYFQKFEFGLFTLQMIDIIIGDLCDPIASKETRSAIELLLSSEYHWTIDNVKSSLEEYYNHLGDADIFKSVENANFEKDGELLDKNLYKPYIGRMIQYF